MTPQEYRAWIKSLQGQQLDIKSEMVDVGQAESATPEGRKAYYIIDPSGQKQYLQQNAATQVAEGADIESNDFTLAGAYGDYYFGNGRKGDTRQGLTRDADGNFSLSGNMWETDRNMSWWDTWGPLVSVALVAAPAIGGVAGWTGPGGVDTVGSDWASGAATTNGTAGITGETAGNIGSDWATGQATTNGSQGVYNTDAGMNALSEVGAGTTVPAATAPYSPSTSPAPGSVTPLSTPVSTPNAPVTPPTSNNSSTSTVPGWVNDLAKTLGLSSSDLMKLFSSGIASYMNNNTANRLMDMYKPYAEQANKYGDMLMKSYTDPNSYLQGPDAQAAMSTTGDYLQRKDAAGGGLSNNFGRQVKLNDYILGNLKDYRTGLNDTYKGLAGIGTGQGAAAATQASGNAMNPLLYTLSGLGQQTSTQNTTQTTGS